MLLLILLSTAIFVINIAAPVPRCPSNMVQLQKNSTICYLLVETPNTFQQAENFCNQKHGTLVPIFDQFTNFFIAVNAHSKFNNSMDFWIGGNLYTDINVSGIWTWTWNRALMVYNDWQVNQPNSNYRCVASNVNSALWTTEDCEVEKPFVCQIPAVIDVCDSKWSYFDETKMCYKLFVNFNSSFHTNNQLCMNQNATLASVHSDSENTFLAQLATFGVPEKFQDEGVWIGLEYRDNDWKWADNTTYNYEAWGPNRPWTNHTGLCARFYPDGIVDMDSVDAWYKKWGSPPCSYMANRFICKKNPASVFVV